MGFQALESWLVLKISNKIIPKWHSIWEETARVTISATSEFLKNEWKIYDNISIRGKTVLKIFRSFFIDYFVWIWRTRLQIRRSDSDSHPSSSESLIRLVPYQAAVTARAAWYWTFSNFSIWSWRDIPKGGGWIQYSRWDLTNAMYICFKDKNGSTLFRCLMIPIFFFAFLFYKQPHFRVEPRVA